MNRRTLWPAMAAGGLLLGLAALAIASLDGPSAGAQSTPGDEDHEVWITELGFNPASCVVRRSDNVRFVNKTNAVRNVIFDDLRPPNDPNTPLSTGDLAPGATSGYYSFDFAGSNEYHEQYNPAWTGAISTTNSGVASCTYLPPTPTPTATPTVSPTPTASPTPPRSPACALPADCAVTGGLARDE